MTCIYAAGSHVVYQEITVKETPSFYFYLLYNMCNHEGFLLFNQRIAVGSTTLHVKCCPGAEDSLANSFPNVWKAIGINLVDVGVGVNIMTMAHKIKCSPSFSHLA